MAAALLGDAAVIGWTPQALWGSGMSEYRASLAGWNRARGAPEPLSRADVERARAQVAAAQKREERRRGG